MTHGEILRNKWNTQRFSGNSKQPYLKYNFVTFIYLHVSGSLKNYKETFN